MKNQTKTTASFKGFAVAIVLFIGAIACAPEEVVSEASPTPTVEIEVVPTPTPSRVPPEPTATPTAEPVRSDWNTLNDYQLDVEETTDQLIELSSIVADIFGPESGFTTAEIQELMGVAAETAWTHYSYFEGTTPPPGYELAHELFVEAIGLNYDGYTAASMGEFEESAVLLKEAAVVIREAGEALP